MYDKRMTMNVDYLDHVYNDRELYGKEKIRKLLTRCAENGFRRVFWRVSACGKAVYHSRVRTVWDGEDAREGSQRLVRILRRFDPLEVAVKYGHELGLEVYGWITIYDEGGPPVAPWAVSGFSRKHPECLFTSRDGGRRLNGALCYAYPEVREHRLAEIEEVASYGVDGVYLCTRSHARPPDYHDIFGYNEPVVREYEKRYGVNILKESFDKRKWYRLRGEYLTLFLSQAKGVLKKRNVSLAVGVKRGHRIRYPLGNLWLDWEKWAGDGIADELVVGAGEDAVRRIDGKWYENLADYSAAAGRMKLTVWLCLWDWWDKVKKKETVPIKSFSQIMGMLERLQIMPADGITVHESLCVEEHSLWDVFQESGHY